MSEQDFTPTIQEMMAQIARMQAELDSLKARVNTQPQPTIQTKAEVSTSRRKLLRRLAGGLVAGLAVGGIGASLPGKAEAKFVSAKGWGAIVVPPGGTISGPTPTGTVYGLYATSDLTTNIGDYLPNYKIGIIGLNTSTATGSTYYGVYGQAYNAGVYGKGDDSGVSGEGFYGIKGIGLDTGVYGSGSSYGVFGTSDTGSGVYGTSNSGTGVSCSSGTGVPFHISSSGQPDAPYDRGDIYIDDSNGTMHIYNGTQWRTVTTTAG